MENIWIVLAFLLGIQCGIIIMCILQAKRQEKLEQYEEQLKRYREKLEQEFDFEFPEPSAEKEYFSHKII
ncbi:MAG: hypothetical protein Q4D16_23400 [Eubacteriales bacterium]|nr:hypothetical protein [Eubacteriales bacterium]